MASTSAEPPLVPLRLPSREQWVLHHVLSKRIERERRSPDESSPLPIGVLRAVQKVESGSHLFTPAELRCARKELEDHLRRTDVHPGERRDIRAAVGRIDDAIASSHAGRPR